MEDTLSQTKSTNVNNIIIMHVYQFYWKCKYNILNNESLTVFRSIDWWYD